MSQENTPFRSIKHVAGMLPKEEMLEVSSRYHSITFGLPADDSSREKRISLVPNAVGLLVQNGHRVLIERGAGQLAWFSDHDYAEYGGELVEKAQVMKADVIVKVATLSSLELEMIEPRTTLITSLYLSSQNEDYFRKLISRKVTALAFEYIQDKTGAYPVRRAMSEMAGVASVTIAAEFLANSNYGRGHMLGGFSGISPSEVVILGAGTAGEYAARSAIGMGALVKVFDNSIFKLKALQTHLSHPVFTSVIQPNVLLKALKSADVIIGSIFTSSGRTPVYVTEEMVSQMKPGSVIIDISIDQGGCIETSHPTDHRNPVFQKYGVTHYCVPNIASRFPHTASYALSNFLAPILLQSGNVGGVQTLMRDNVGFRRGVYMYNGIITHRQVSDYFNLPFQDIDLLITAF